VTIKNAIKKAMLSSLFLEYRCYIDGVPFGSDSSVFSLPFEVVPEEVSGTPNKVVCAGAAGAGACAADDAAEGRGALGFFATGFFGAAFLGADFFGAAFFATFFAAFLGAFFAAFLATFLGAFLAAFFAAFFAAFLGAFLAAFFAFFAIAFVGFGFQILDLYLLSYQFLNDYALNLKNSLALQ
jgi:hypothetical protein